MRSRHDPRRSFRPLLEALEARALLSGCTVDRLTEVGEGKGTDAAALLALPLPGPAWGRP